LLLILFFCGGIFEVFCQSTEIVEGLISYMTSQNVYVKFQSTKGIAIGDTLFVRADASLQPAILVKHISSMSCVGSPVNRIKLVKGQALFWQPMVDAINRETVKMDSVKEEKEIYIDPQIEKPVQESEINPKNEVNQQINGRLSMYSYSNFSNVAHRSSQRMRYTFSMKAQHINNSKLTLENYISFRHKIGEWNRVKENINDALKIYNLAATYHLSANTKVSLGRKNSRYITNVGAIDGLQFETRAGSLIGGLIFGSRPDYSDYSFNFNYRQYGAYLGHELDTKNGSISNTLAFVEQKNHGQTDRRYAYYQHVNTVLKNVSLFYSFEVDLYQKVNDLVTHDFRFSSAFVSLRWRASRKLSISSSYDARRNIIYYESYKSFIDRLIEEETRQGLRVSINIRPVKGISLGVNGGYRFQKDQKNESKNIYSYLSFTRVPGLKMTTTLSASYLESPYLKSKIYGMRSNKDLIPAKLFGEVSYRKVIYNYLNADQPIVQDMAGVGISWRISKKISFSLHYEGTIENKNNYHRLFAQLTKRIY